MTGIDTFLRAAAVVLLAVIVVLLARRENPAPPPPTTTATTITAPPSLPAAMPPRWAYRVDTPRDPEFIDRMNELGREGWEVVSMRRVEETDLEVLANNGSRMKFEVLLRRAVE